MSYSSRTKHFFSYKTFIYMSILFIIWLNVIFSQDGVNVLVNGEFDNGTSGWNINRLGTARAGISLSADSILSGINSLKIDITAGGDSLADIRIRHSLNLQMGRYYKIFFMATANKECSIQPVFNSSSSSAATIWRGTVTTITTKPQHFGPFTYRSQLSDASRAISFLVGGNDSTSIWIDSVVVEMTDDPENTSSTEALVDSVKNVLNQLIQSSGNEYLKLHFNSIINVIESKENLLRYDYSSLRGFLRALQSTDTTANPRNLSSYLNRVRPFIIAWISPTDGKVSFAQALPPANWDPNKEYPLYVALHGLWNVADNPIYYLSIYLSPGSFINEPYDDGYLLMPWGRGNLWYEGISETDVWEGISVLESVVKVDKNRKYLTGHSMGGYGTWKIAQNSVDTWAAIGIHAGALQYNNYALVNQTAVQKLKDKPVYFVVGDQDGLLTINQQLYQMLQNAGNKNLSFNIFPGGHVYLYNNLKGMNDWLKNFSLNSQTGVKVNNKITPSKTLLNQNYPNPFNPETTIKFSLKENVMVSLKVYNILGEVVETLLNKDLKAGTYSINWKPNENTSSGVYFSRLTAGGYTKVMKMIYQR